MKRRDALGPVQAIRIIKFWAADLRQGPNLVPAYCKVY